MKNPILEQTRKKGRHGDTVLAHINPKEAKLLKDIGGSGTKNPDTGLPEYFFRGVRNFVRNPGKTVGKTLQNPMRTIADTIGTGAAIFGGPLGGAIGGATRSLIRGDNENPLLGALKGGAYGTVLPYAANLAGQGLSGMGATSIGQGLQDYGTKASSSWLGSMGKMGEGTAGLFGGQGKGVSAGDVGDVGDKPWGDVVKVGGEKYRLMPDGKYKAVPKSFGKQLLKNSKDFLSKPKNLLTLGTMATQFMDREKKLSPKQKGSNAKEEMLAQRLTPQELSEQEEYELQLEQGRRRNARKKFLPEERIDIEPLYTGVNSPEEYARSGRWLNYYDDPELTKRSRRF